MKAKELNLVVIILITLFMGYLALFSDRSAKDIAIIGAVMALLNSGIPISVMLDKFTEMKK